MDGEDHARARKAIAADFTYRRAEALRPRIQQITDGFIDAMLDAGPPADLVQALALPVPSLVSCDHLGVPYSDHAYFQDLALKLLQQGTTDEERVAVVGELRGYLGKLVASKEKSPGDDIISDQIRKHVGKLSDVDREDLVGLGFLLLIAGHETTANMISLGVVALLENPDQLARIKADPSKIPGAVQELLRYFTIVETVTGRVATADIEVGGVLIRAGDGVIVSGAAADRDDTLFPDPDRLDISRDARPHLAFGYGPHRCLGDNLATVELQVVYETLFRRIPNIQLTMPYDELPYKYDANFYGLYELPVTW
jgi:cytochrome P450